MKKNKYCVVSAINRGGKCIITTTTIKAYFKLHAKILFKKNHKTTYVGCLRVVE